MATKIAGKGYSVDYLIMLCRTGDMAEHANSFCELLEIESPAEVWEKMRAFQIGDNEDDRKSKGQSADNTSVFLLTVALSPSVQIIAKNDEYIEFVFIYEDLCRTYFNKNDQDGALEGRGKAHRSLYLLLKGCEANGVRVKIFK